MNNIKEVIDEIVVFNNFMVPINVFHDHRFIAQSLYENIKEKVVGDVVELGCFVGESSKIIRRTIDYTKSDKKYYAYDSFEGLPEPDIRFDGFSKGDMATTEEDILANFKKNELEPPIITKTWFKDIRSDQLPDSICFGFFDGDFYESIKDSFEKIWPLLTHGGSVCVHDYFSNSLKGAKKATDDFLLDKHHYIRRAHKDRDLGHDIILIYKY